MGRRGRRPGPEPKAPEDRRRLLVGVKVSARELSAFQAAAGPVPVATWMRGRALEALEARAAREALDGYVAQARALSDRAAATLAEVDRRIGERIAVVERLVRKTEGSRPAKPTRGSGTAPVDGTKRRT